jgi:hypothetical protein
MKPGPKPLLGMTLTHAERQARYRATQAQGSQRSDTATQPIVAADRSGGVTLWLSCWSYRPTTRRGSMHCRRIWRMEKRQTRYE